LALGWWWDLCVGKGVVDSGREDWSTRRNIYYCPKQVASYHSFGRRKHRSGAGPSRGSTKPTNWVANARVHTLLPVITVSWIVISKFRGANARSTVTVFRKMMTERPVSLHVVYLGPTVELPVPTSGTCVGTTHMCDVGHGSMVTMQLERQFNSSVFVLRREDRPH
jgi:hypothetical protein